MLLCFLAAARITTYTLPADKLAKAVHLSHAGTLAHFGGVATTAFALWLLARSGAGAAIEHLAARITRRAWLQCFIAAPIWLLILTLLDLPWTLYLHIVYRAAGISVSPWSMWAGDVAKSTALTIIVGTAALSALYALMRHSPRRWWIWFWLLAIPCEVLAVFVVPIMIDPLFNHFTPLAQQNPPLVDQLERVAAKGNLNISPDRMFAMDASRKVAAPNAYVTGFGASKRIVVWDTSLSMEAPDEILSMYGHEQGHYVLHHIYLGMLYSFAVMLVFFWIAFHLLRWMTARYGLTWKIEALSNWSSLGMLLFVVTVLGFLAEPVGNVFSRWEEHAADVYGQEVLHGLVSDPQGVTARGFQHLGELWLEDPQPNPVIEFWTNSHPSVSERVRFAANYDPWAPNHHPRYFSK